MFWLDNQLAKISVLPVYIDADLNSPRMRHTWSINFADYVGHSETLESVINTLLNVQIPCIMLSTGLSIRGPDTD